METLEQLKAALKQAEQDMVRGYEMFDADTMMRDKGVGIRVKAYRKIQELTRQIEGMR